MSKKASNTNTAPAYVTGTRVTVSLSDTALLVGIVETVTPQGWYIVLLDPESQQAMTEAGDKRMKDGKISARARSLSLHVVPDTAEEAVAPAAPDTAEEVPAIDPRNLTTCPVCGSSEIYHGRNVDGLVVNEDTCGGCHHCDWSWDLAPQGSGSRMAQALREARVRYVKTKRPEGSASMDCGDLLARTLRDLEPLEVAALADKVLGEAPGYHAGKYDHLNPGQIRMNSGNRIRSLLKTGSAPDLQRAYEALGWDTDEENEEEGDE